jgi:hypothetical protein
VPRHRRPQQRQRRSPDLIAWPCNGGSNERWYPSGSQIRSHFNGKCLDVGSPRPRPETQVVVWDCNRGAGQRWWW